MKYITISELKKRIEDELRQRGCLVERTSGYSSWHEAKIVDKDKFAGALEKVIRDCLLN